MVGQTMAEVPALWHRGLVSRVTARVFDLIAAIGAVCALAVLLASCGTGGSSSSSGLDGWVTTNGTSIAYLSMTEAKGALTGRLDAASLDGEDVSTRSVGFSGVHEGKSVSLKLESGVTVTGTLTNSEMRLTFSDADGVVQQFVLRPGTSGRYNEALRALQASGAALREQRVAQERTAASVQEQQDAAALAERARERAISSLADATDALRSWLSSHPANPYAVAWTSYDRALASLRAGDAKVAAMVAAGAECGDLESALGDVHSYRGDVSSAHGDYESTDADAQSEVRDGQGYVDGAQEAVVGVAIADQPGDLASVLRQGGAAVAALTASRSTAAEKAAAYDRTADGIVTAAEARLPTRCS